MARYERFTFLLNKNERAALAALAARFERSQSDAVRFLIRREAAHELTDAPRHATPTASVSAQQAGVVNYANS